MFGQRISTNVGCFAAASGSSGWMTWQLVPSKWAGFLSLATNGFVDTVESCHNFVRCYFAAGQAFLQAERNK